MQTVEKFYMTTKSDRVRDYLVYAVGSGKLTWCSDIDSALERTIKARAYTRQWKKDRLSCTINMLPLTEDLDLSTNLPQQIQLGEYVFNSPNPELIAYLLNMLPRYAVNSIIDCINKSETASVHSVRALKELEPYMDFLNEVLTN